MFVRYALSCLVHFLGELGAQVVVEPLLAFPRLRRLGRLRLASYYLVDRILDFALLGLLFFCFKRRLALVQNGLELFELPLALEELGGEAVQLGDLEERDIARLVARPPRRRMNALWPRALVVRHRASGVLWRSGVSACRIVQKEGRDERSSLLIVFRTNQKLELLTLFSQLRCFFEVRVEFYLRFELVVVGGGRFGGRLGDILGDLRVGATGIVH